MAQKLNIVIDQGTSFYTTFNVNDDAGNPIDLTGYIGSSQLRKHYTSSNATPFTVTMDSSGTVQLSMTSNVTSSLTAGRYVYDVEVYDGSNTSRLVEGIVTVTPQVTR